MVEIQVSHKINGNENFSYCIDIKLGEGRCAHVFPGKFKEQEVAVKRIQLLDLSEESEREIDNLNQLHHEHIVKFLHCEEDDNFRYIAFERCNTDLRKYVSSPEYDQVLTDESYKIRARIRVILQLAEALKFIHSRKIIHRDIKPDNVLVSNNGSSVIMKWADFGDSKHTNCCGSASMSGPRGTECWLAPEIIKFFDGSESKARCSRKSDIFSAGCVFFFFLTKGVHPYGDEKTKVDLQQNIINKNMKNKKELDELNPASLTVLEMMENRLGLEKVIKELKLPLDIQSVRFRKVVTLSLAL